MLLYENLGPASTRLHSGGLFELRSNSATVAESFPQFNANLHDYRDGLTEPCADGDRNSAAVSYEHRRHAVRLLSGQRYRY